MKNPLLENKDLPQFDKITANHVIPAIKYILQQNRQELHTILENKDSFAWQNLITPLEIMQDRLSKTWSMVMHLNSVKNSPKLRVAYEKALPEITKYHIELGQNKKLYEAMLQLNKSKGYRTLNSAQKKILHDYLRDFCLAGVALEAKKKLKFLKLQQRLAHLCNKFANNVLDATYGWEYLVKKESELAGIPEHVVVKAKNFAEQKKKSGWLFNLESPAYVAIQTYADSENLRKIFYTAFVTKASGEKTSKKKWDNSKLIDEILFLRKEIIELLGFNNYAEYSLATKTAKKTSEVLNFLNSLANKAKPIAKKEFAELCQFAQSYYGKKQLQPWDISYYSEKLRQEKYSINAEELRQYFPEDYVLDALFSLVRKIFGMQVKEIFGAPVWHKDVKFFSICDKSGKIRGKFYIDLYAREHKRGGAWMDSCRSRMKFADNDIQVPIAYLICNFTPPSKSKPSLLTHDEVDVLFHEFGHCLQHLLTTVDYLSASGVNGVPWDTVEFPSQFMERWCWEPKVLAQLSQHYITKKPLPTKIIEQMIEAKKTQSGLLMLRQLEFSLFDFKLHMEFNPKIKNQTQKIFDAIRKIISVIPVAKFNRMQHSFLHIFDGSYAAGYYSYKWAEVLASDAFAKFKQQGIFNAKVGSSFLHNILEVGGSIDPMLAFQKFRGRKAKIDALIKELK